LVETTASLLSFRLDLQPRSFTVSGRPGKTDAP
jgi:hypothetical protein